METHSADATGPLTLVALRHGVDHGVMADLHIPPTEDRRAVRAYLLMAAVPVVALVLGLIIVLT